MPSSRTTTRLGQEQAQRQTANIMYFDAAIRHQIGVQNLTTNQVNELVSILDKADKELTDKLNRILRPFIGKPLRNNTEKYKHLLTQIKAARSVALRHVKKEFQHNLIDLAKIEEEFERRMATSSLPVVIDFATVPTETLTALVRNQPMAIGPSGARTLDQWFSSLERADLERIISAVQLGIIQGEGIDDIVSRVAGTRGNRFQDGALALSRTNLEAIVRTAVNSISNTARESVWQANSDVLEFLAWTATLDFRTCPICQSRDGKLVSIGDHKIPKANQRLEPQSARPPAHVRCRCILVAVFSINGIVERIGERPFVRSADRPKQRQINFRDQAKEQSGEAWDTFTSEERKQAVKRIATSWAERNIGRVPSAITYQDWLKTQPSAFQDQVLGKTKGKLFRTGKVTVDDFVTTQGNAVTLKQLANSDPTAFIAAGINPEDF